MRISVVSHDSGGAEVLSHYIKENNINARYHLPGPALMVFERNLGKVLNSSLEEIVEYSDLILTGISWGSKIEVSAIKKARDKGVKSVSFLDHWNFRALDFTLNATVILPDGFVVFDLFAYKRALKEFPNSSLILLPNPYLNAIKEEIQSIMIKSKIRKNLNILYVSEPTNLHHKLDLVNQVLPISKKNNKNSDLEVFKYFLSNLFKLKAPIDKIIIRPHPSEHKSKFDFKYLKLSNLIEISKNVNLSQDIAECDFIVGSQTMAMVVGLISNKRVICAIPPGGGECIIPFPGIEMLRDL